MSAPKSRNTNGAAKFTDVFCRMITVSSAAA
ncbi:hypothetical protein HNR73_007241 [Phytomonospora endophytica]|uniref:Uncharacterized protein n=1 Tax=Phytomonospora endophytica TaxID=714109 RepID=A0A841G110_9ACTN|nr:hypothetical protein [Phytomonospora endophytica]